MCHLQPKETAEGNARLWGFPDCFAVLHYIGLRTSVTWLIITGPSKKHSWWLMHSVRTALLWAAMVRKNALGNFPRLLYLGFPTGFAHSAAGITCIWISGKAPVLKKAFSSCAVPLCLAAGTQMSTGLPPELQVIHETPVPHSTQPQGQRQNGLQVQKCWHWSAAGLGWP